MKKAYEIFRSELDSIKEAGTYKDSQHVRKQLPRPFQQS